MSTSVRHLSVQTILTVVVLAATHSALRADEQLDQVKKLNAIALQKLESEYRDVLKQAYEVGKKEPAKAAEILREFLPRIEASQILSETRRKQMLGALLSRIEDNDLAAKRGARQQTEDAERELRKNERFADQQRTEQDASDQQRLLARIRELKAQGRYKEAAELADQLARNHGTTPASSAAYRGATIAEQIAEAKKLRQERGNRYLGTLRDVDRAAMLPIGDIEFPDARKWQELTKRRKAQENPLSEKEKALLRALNTPVTTSFKNQSFKETLEYLQKLTGQNIIITKETMELAQITYETEVSATVRGSTARTLLRKIAGELGLTFVIKDESIQLLTPLQARDLTTTRVYYLGDIAGLVDIRLPPIFNQAIVAQTVANIVDMIQSIEPSSWRINGGVGTIAVQPGTLSLIIKQSAEMHYVLSGALK